MAKKREALRTMKILQRKCRSVFLAFADDTFVFTTYGTISSHFGQGSMGSWLVTAYNLGFAVSLPVV
ncbi:hypothetical protein N7516_010040 [Penicillium verrucosum]|uniref:uncharacterized protein n=1 Tax=Penicillium verrucosum TaxID=60171 RepID=UPI0025451B24|nr:uncharacterized protein N7516_010040 [Penicillium verrucosum]KAJ5922337.1 hypothetical protein N7516_010040 [Penicillium verrucosum]